MQAVGAALNAALEVADLKQSGGRDATERPDDVALRLDADEQVNTTTKRTPLSVVVRIYSLKSSERFSTLSYEEAADQASAAKALGNALVAEREVTLLPGKTYDLKQQLPTEANVVGVVALFRSPFKDRWKLAFDGKTSKASGITVGVHSCALTAGHGTLLYPLPPSHARSLIGVRCDS